MDSKKITQAILVIIVAVLLIYACKKGDAGAVGQAGAAGTQGSQGVAGPAGSAILSGTTAPAATIGKVGDFYLNLTASNLYGPKTGGGWGNSLELKGATGENGNNGAAGTNGNTILSGTGIPIASQGTNGDYYLDKLTFNFYGPKKNNLWSVPTALIGPQGPMGNANVKIDTFTVKSEDWLYNSVYYVGTGPGAASGYFSKYVDRVAAALTSSFLNKEGIVMVYFQSNPDYNSTVWSPMPFTFTAFSGYAVNYAYETLVGKLRLHFYLTKVTADPPTVASYVISKAKVKIVLATGTVVSSLSAAHVNKNNSVEVAKYLGMYLKDK